MMGQLKAAGFEEKNANDDKYWKSFCPAMVDLKNDAEKYCKFTSTCSFTSKDAECEVPNVKPVCCDLFTDLLPCETRLDKKVCQENVVNKMMGQLKAAGFEEEKANDDKYWKSFCPAIADLENNAEKYCKSTDTSAPTSLLYTLIL